MIKYTIPVLQIWLSMSDWLWHLLQLYIIKYKQVKNEQVKMGISGVNVTMQMLKTWKTEENI